MKKILCAALIASTTFTPAMATLEDARQLVSTGKLQEAFDHYLGLVFQNPRNLDINFELGMVAMNVGRNEVAVNAFERILMVNPDLPRVRLELGRAYMLLENTLLARQEFQRVLDQQPPDQVRQNVEQLMAQMDQAEKRLHIGGRFTVGAMRDSNVNVSTFNNELRLAGGIPFNYNGEAYSKWADMQALDVSVKHDIGQRGGFGIDYGAGGTRIKYHGIPNGENYDTNLISLSVTPHYAMKNAIVRVGFLADEIQIAGERYARYYGIAPEYIMPLGQQWMLPFRGIIQKRDVANNTEQDSTFYSIETSPRYTFASGKTTLSPTVKYARNNANNDENSYRAASAGLSGYTILPFDIIWTAAYNYTHTSYDERTFLFDAARRDKQHQWRTGLSRGFSYGVTASLSYTYNQNRSNQDLFDYNREQTMLMLSKEF